MAWASQGGGTHALKLRKLDIDIHMTKFSCALTQSFLATARNNEDFPDVDDSPYAAEQETAGHRQGGREGGVETILSYETWRKSLLYPRFVCSWERLTILPAKS